MRDLNPGTGSSNLAPSSGESTNFRFLCAFRSCRPGIRATTGGRPPRWLDDDAFGMRGSTSPMRLAALFQVREDEPAPRVGAGLY